MVFPLAQITAAGSVDYFKIVTRFLDQLVSTHDALFVTLGQEWLAALFVLRIAWVIVEHYIFARGSELDVMPIGKAILRWGFLYTLLLFWVVPIPVVGVSFHELIPRQMSAIANTIDISCVNALTDALKTGFISMEVPGTFNFLGAGIYGATTVVIALCWFTVFGVTVISYCQVGVASLVGPLFIPWGMLPGTSWIFNGFVRFELIYSFWRVAASAFTFVWGNAMLTFWQMMFGTGPHGDYSLGHMLIVTPIMGMLMLGFAGCMFTVYLVSRDLFSGSASMNGGATISMITGAARSGLALAGRGI